MKKILLTIITLTSLSSLAQVKIKAGINSSSISGSIKTDLTHGPGANGRIYENGDYKDYTDSKQGIYIGIGYDIQISDKVTFIPELLYNQYGAEEKYNYRRIDRESDFYKLDYLSVPVMIRYEFIPRLSIGLGPQINFLLNPKSTYNYLNVKEQHEDVDFYNKIYLGANGDLSYNIWNGLSIDFRYHFGLSNSGYNGEIKDPNTLTVFKINNKAHNHAIQIGLSYNF